MRTILKGVTLMGLTSLAACTSGQSAVEPTVRATAIATLGVPQLAVGVATFNRGVAGSVTGLNVVATYRQANGLAAVLLNTPVLTGPAGFAVPKAPVPVATGTPFACPAAFSTTTGVAGPDCPGTDGGTNAISGSLPAAQPSAQPVAATTLGVTGGVFAYGFQPANTTNTTITNNEAGGSRYVPFPIPFYDPGDRRVVVGGPPAYVNFRDGTYPPSPQFIGFNQGFVPFMGVTLAAGTYNLALTVPSSPTSNVVVNATAPLNTPVNSIGLYPVPAGITRDGAGGFTVTVAPPAGVTETIVDVTDTGTADGTNTCHVTTVTLAPPYYYSAVIGAGGTTATFPANVGPIDPGGKQTPTACTGDRLAVTAYGFNYPAYESGVGLPGQGAPPQTPRLTGSNGQADVSISPTLSVVY